VTELIRFELYGEYVKARNEIAKEHLLDWVFFVEDDMPFPELTPKHPLLRKFTPEEIFNFEDLLRKDMMIVHRPNPLLSL
jgi:ABC-type sulfate transport system substrate-binding protein